MKVRRRDRVIKRDGRSAEVVIGCGANLHAIYHLDEDISTQYTLNLLQYFTIIH